MQKALWGHLQKFPQFVLTGRTLDRFVLSDLLERETRFFPKYPLAPANLFEDWVSGDYSAATDTLDIRHTKAVLEMALLHVDWSPKHQDVLRSVLYEQTIEYPQGAVPKFRQRTGQLMGSVLSFPVLCIVNLVTYWSALEEYIGAEVEIDDLPVLVNGDDILFRANTGFYEIWKHKAKSAGFALSLGKNYIHPRFFTVNSELWYCQGGDPNTLKFLPFLNVGLLTGQSKITGRQNASLCLCGISITSFYEDLSTPFVRIAGSFTITRGPLPFSQVTAATTSRPTSGRADLALSPENFRT
jgi:hypothetical protein